MISRFQVVEIMVPKQQNDFLFEALLKFNDLPEVIDLDLSRHSIMRIKVVAKKDLDKAMKQLFAYDGPALLEITTDVNLI